MNKPKVLICDDQQRDTIKAALLYSGIGIITNHHYTTLPNIDPFVKIKRMKDKEIKECCECGKTHSHHNSFCSAECCKAYKNRR